MINIIEGDTVMWGLDIHLFIPKWGDKTHANFQMQGDFSYNGAAPDDPRPYLRRAIKALKEELIDINKCPVHKKLRTEERREKT